MIFEFFSGMNGDIFLIPIIIIFCALMAMNGDIYLSVLLSDKAYRFCSEIGETSLQEP
jgi:hypothetical protein